jgi:hypothetical protein
MQDPERSGLSVGFTPIDLKAEITRDIPGVDLKMEVLFEPGIFGKAEATPELKATTAEALAGGYKYLFELMGPSFGIDKKLLVQLTQGQRPMHQGSMMLIPIKLLEEFRDPETPVYTKDSRQAQIIHELLHNLTDEEALPILAEISYMLEKGHPERVGRIKELLDQGELNPAHIKGLETLAKDFGLDKTGDLFDFLLKEDVNILKSHLRRSLNEMPEAHLTTPEPT